MLQAWCGGSTRSGAAACSHALVRRALAGPVGALPGRWGQAGACAPPSSSHAAFPHAAAARLEAVIDFGEDEGIADDVAAGVLPLVAALRQQLQSHLEAASGGELVRSGVRIALLGPPNVGKSSLLNLLAGHEAAIVSPVAGTTRDAVQVQLELGGIKVGGAAGWLGPMCSARAPLLQLEHLQRCPAGHSH